MSYQLGTAKVWDGAAWVDAVGGGLGWATVSDTPTGSYNDGTYDWEYWEFATTGTLTVTEAGLLDVVVCGGGGGACNRAIDRTMGGVGGGVAWGILEVVPETITVTVGTGGASSNSASNGYAQATDGNTSSFGNYQIARGGPGAGMSGGSIGTGNFGDGWAHSPGQRIGASNSSYRSDGFAFSEGVFGVDAGGGVPLSYTGSTLSFGVRGTSSENNTTNTKGGGGAALSGSYGARNGRDGLVVVRKRL